MNNLLQTLRNLGPAKLGAMGGVLLGLLGFFGYMVSSMSTPETALLYADLDAAESGEIVARLEEMGVPYELRAQGSSIFVPEDQVNRLRLSMAQEGLPRDGSLGYEIFDQSDAFGTTSFVQNINRLRALEGELARTIQTIEGVDAARVHLVLPERQLFSREEQEPSASVFVRLSRASLAPEQILAIQQLVSSAVPRLEAGHIAIIDDRGNLLASAETGDEEELLMMNADSLRTAHERRVAGTIEELLSRTVGFGKVRAQVSAEMDFDRVTTTAETFDPDSQVARSTQFIEEQSNETEADNPVTVAENLPEAGALPEEGGPVATANSTRTEETTNFEINRTVQNTVRQAGTVERLSVAVLVDGTYTDNEDGTTTYAPRSEAEMEQLAALVRSAIGFDAARGDTVEVVNMQFAAPDESLFEPEEELLLGMNKDDIFRLVEMMILAVVGVLVILLVVRPVLNRVLDGAKPAALPAPEEAAGLLTHQPGTAPALVGPDGAVVAAGEGAGDEAESLVGIGQVEGGVKASTLRKMGELIDQQPEQAVSIIRAWMYQEAA